MYIRLDTVEKVKDFVGSMEKYHTQMDLISGRREVDARSLLGIFSLDLTKPLEVRVLKNNRDPEAVQELIRHGFEDLKLKRLWCGYFDGNIKSRRVQEKCGFVYHHTNKDIYWKLMDDIRTEHITCLEPDSNRK